MNRKAPLDDKVEKVRALVRSRLRGLRGVGPDQVEVLVGGKMLRARLALRLAGLTPVAHDLIIAVAAAVEMIHAASLLHDDVIDGAEIRRGRSAFWRLTSPQGSILTGDLLFADAACLLAETGSADLLGRFCLKVREMCEAEAVQELSRRAQPTSEEQCLAVARGKTGALFAFVAEACAGGDPALGPALEEAGYRLGTAYQLADDLLDLTGDEGLAGKTLGTDRRRGKLTLPALYRSQASPGALEGTPEELVWERVRQLIASVPPLLAPWPPLRAAVTQFTERDLRSTMEKLLGAGLKAGTGP